MNPLKMYLEMKKNNSKADLRVKLRKINGEDLVSRDSAKVFAC